MLPNRPRARRAMDIAKGFTGGQTQGDGGKSGGAAGAAGGLLASDPNLGFGEPTRSRARRLHLPCAAVQILAETELERILATADHAADHDDPDAGWLVDLDLTPLGEPWPAFQANSRVLRQEMGTPDDCMIPGQAAFLRRLLALPRREVIFSKLTLQRILW